VVGISESKGATYQMNFSSFHIFDDSIEPVEQKQRRCVTSTYTQPTMNQRQWPGLVVFDEIYVFADGEDEEMKS
jgi:hypothetical protein